MYINILNYFDFDRVFWEHTPTNEILYYVWMVSKSTGELYEFSFDKLHFDMLLDEMELNVKAKYCTLYDIPRIINYGEF